MYVLLPVIPPSMAQANAPTFLSPVPQFRCWELLVYDVTHSVAILLGCAWSVLPSAPFIGFFL